MISKLLDYVYNYYVKLQISQKRKATYQVKQEIQKECFNFSLIMVKKGEEKSIRILEFIKKCIIVIKLIIL